MSHVTRLENLEREFSLMSNGANAHAIAQFRTLAIGLITLCKKCNKCASGDVTKTCPIFNSLFPEIEKGRKTFNIAA